MEISQSRLSEVKKNFYSIFFLSGLQIWWAFNYPLYQRLRYPWNIVISLLIGIIGTIAIIYLFSDPKKHVSNLQHGKIDETIYGHNIIKKLMPMWGAFVYFLTLFLIWYNNFFKMASLYYLILIVYTILSFVLLMRAARKTERI